MNSVKALDLFGHDRIDLAIKYAYVKSSIENKDRDISYSVYCKHIFSRTGGFEPKNHFDEHQSKKTLDDYVQAFDSLINNYHPKRRRMNLPVNANGKILDGAHRLALAIYYGVDVDVSGHSDKKVGSWQWDDLELFSEEEKLFVLKICCEVDDSLIPVIFWDEESHKNFRFLNSKKRSWEEYGSVQLDFNENYQSFVRLVYEIYHAAESNRPISRKISELLKKPLKLTVSLITSESFQSLTDLKCQIRVLAKSNDDPNGYLSMHAPDSFSESQYLSRLLFQSKLRERLSSRFNWCISSSLHDYLCEFQSYLRANKLDAEDFIVVGSACLDAAGILRSSDLDVSCTKDLRDKKYGSRSQKLSKNIDLVYENYDRVGGLSDDDLINNDAYHFIYYGIKFCALSIVRDRKEYSARRKDLYHSKMISHYLNYLAFNTTLPMGLSDTMAKLSHRRKFLHRVFRKLKSLVS